MLISLFVGMFVFDVPLKGSPALLLVSSCVFLFGALALGHFDLGHEPQPAFGVSDGHADVVPAGVSAFGFHLLASRTCRVVIQFIALFVPARYFIDIVKGIFLKGIGLRFCGSISCCWWCYGGADVFFSDAEAAAEGGVT